MPETTTPPVTPAPSAPPRPAAAKGGSKWTTIGVGAFLLSLLLAFVSATPAPTPVEAPKTVASATGPEAGTVPAVAVVPAVDTVPAHPPVRPAASGPAPAHADNRPAFWIAMAGVLTL